MTFKFIKSETLIWLIKAGNYLILLLPLVVIPSLIFPYVFPRTIIFQIIVEIIFVFYLLLLVKEPSLRPKFNALNLSVPAFLAIFVLSTIFSQDRLMSFWGGLEWHNGLFLMLHLVVWFFILQIFSRREFLSFLKVSVWIGFFVCLSAVCQLMGMFFPAANGGRAAGILGNATFLSAYLIFHLFITVVAYVADKNLNWRVFCFFNFLINLIIFALCQTRGAILGLLAGFFVAGVIYVFFYAKKYRRILIGAVVAITLIGGLCLYSFYEKTQTDPQRSNNVMTRVLAWQAAWRGWQEHFWLGYGSENFYLAFNKNFDPEYLTYSTSGGLGYEAALNFPHNKILDIGLSHGIFGVIAYLAIFAGAVFTLYKKKRDTYDFLILTALLAAYFVQNLFLFDYILSFLMFFLALGFINSRETEPAKLEDQSVKPFYLSLWGLLAVLVFYIMIKGNFLMLRDSYLGNQAWLEYKRNHYVTAVENYQKLYQRHSYVTDKACDDLEVFAATLMKSNLENKQAQEFYQFALSEVETCLNRHDQRISAYIQLAELYNSGHDLK